MSTTLRFPVPILPLLLAAMLPRPAAAHDFWIEPSTFRPEPGTEVSARLLVGERFRGDPLPRRESHIARFVLLGPEGESPFTGKAGADPAGAAHVSAPGLHVIGYESRASSVDLDPDKLAIYVREEGLEPFFRGDLAKPIRDEFSRCAKSLVRVGPGRPKLNGFDRRLGSRLEIVPEANPYALGVPRVLPVRLLENGKPLRDALVTAIERSRPDEGAVRMRTDAKGRARLALPRPGVWLVKAVWIEPVAGAPGAWRSWWASLTFEVPDAEARRGSRARG